MEIQQLRYFHSLLNFHDRNEPLSRLHSLGLTIDQITTLEHYFFPETDQKFPEVLRELLFLCGAYCPYFDTGCFLSEAKEGQIDQLLNKQHSNPYFLYREKHDWPVFFNQKDIWVLFTVYESSDSFWYIDLRGSSSNTKLHFFDAEALYNGETEVISADIDKEQNQEILLSQMMVVFYRENASNNEKDFSIAYQSLYNQNDSKEVLQERFCELIRYEDLEGLRYFMSKGADLCYNHYEAVWLAGAMNFVDGLSLFFNDLKEEKDLLEAIFIDAIQKDVSAIVWQLLDKYQISQEGKDLALAMAVSLNKIALVETLMHNGADVNSNDSLPMCLALRNEHDELMELLAYQNNFTIINGGIAQLYKESLVKNNLMWILSKIENQVPTSILIETHEQLLKDLFGKHYQAHFFKAIEK